MLRTDALETVRMEDFLLFVDGQLQLLFSLEFFLLLFFDELVKPLLLCLALGSYFLESFVVMRLLDF